MRYKIYSLKLQHSNLFSDYCWNDENLISEKRNTQSYIVIVKRSQVLLPKQRLLFDHEAEMMRRYQQLRYKNFISNTNIGYQCLRPRSHLGESEYESDTARNILTIQSDNNQYLLFMVRNLVTTFFFFKKFWMDPCSFLGPLISLFRTSGDVSSGFQRQSGQPYSHLVEGSMFLRFTSGATLLLVYVASIVVGHFPTCVIQQR